MEHVTANSGLHAKLGIRTSIVVKFYKIPIRGVGGLPFTRNLDDERSNACKHAQTKEMLYAHGGIKKKTIKQ